MSAAVQTVHRLDAAAAEATHRLYEAHARELFGFCARRLDADDAEDAVQQTFLKAFAALRGGVVPVAEKPWLYRIAANVCTDRLRATTYRRRNESDGDAAAAEAPACDRESLARVRDALASLGDRQRRALLLREWHGLSYREIARELEVSEGAVETLLFRARRALSEKRNSFAFAGWLKSLAAGGGVKVAATAATAVTVVAGVVAAPAALDRPRRDDVHGRTAPRPTASPARTPVVRGALQPPARDGARRVRATVAGGPAATEAPKRGPTPTATGTADEGDRPMPTRSETPAGRDETGSRALAPAPSDPNPEKPTQPIAAELPLAVPATPVTVTAPEVRTPELPEVQVPVVEDVVDDVAGAVPEISTPTLP